MSQPDYLISTPENVDLHLELAGLGNRIIAALVDTLYTYVLILLVILFTVLLLTGLGYLPVGSKTQSAIMYALIGMAILTSLTIYFGYYIFFEGRWHGQTPGKRLMRIRVIEQNGQPISWGSAFIRNLIRTVDTGIALLGLLVIVIDKNERRLGDLAAGTLVIRERLQGEMSGTQQIQITATSNGHLDVGRISAREYDLLLSFLERRDRLSKMSRQLMANRLNGFFRLRLQEEDNPEPPETFLEKIYLAYQQRADQNAES